MQKIRNMLLWQTDQPGPEMSPSRIYKIIYITFGVGIGLVLTNLYARYRLHLKSEEYLPPPKFNNDRIYPTVEFRKFEQEMFELKRSKQKFINNAGACVSKIRSMHSTIVNNYHLKGPSLCIATRMNGVKCLWYMWPGVGKPHSDIKTEIDSLVHKSNTSGTPPESPASTPISNLSTADTNIFMNANLATTENTDNGVIICCHGGEYIQGGADSIGNFCCTLSRLTNMRTLSIDYRLSPEYLISYAINDIIKVYQYMLSAVESSKQIVLCGNGAGAGLILLAMQQLNKNNASQTSNREMVPLPLCCVLISPYCDLTGNSWTLPLNNEYDCMLNYQKNGYLSEDQIPAEYIIGNLNIDGKTKKKNRNKNRNKRAFSACFSSFNNFCDLFFMVSQTEVLLNDSLLCAQQCKQAEVNFELEIHPYLCHSYPIYCGVFPEANEACMRIASYIKRKQNQADAGNTV